MDKTKVLESASKLVGKGAYDKAIKEFQRILDVDPDDVRVLQKLAELYQKMNRKAEAADCFEKVAKSYSAQGFYLKAVALYKQVLKVIERVEVNVKLAELYQQLGLIGDATKEWQAVAAHYEKTGDTKASLDTLKKLIDLDPDNVAARIRLGEQYARQDQLVEAVAELRRAAQYLKRNGRGDDYLRVAERISHLDQADAGLAKELAEHFLSRGDTKRALAKLQVCFKANPRDVGTLQMLARAFEELGQISKTVSVLKELARVHADEGRADQSREVYENLSRLAPDDGEVRAALQKLGSGAAPSSARATPPRSRPAAAAAPLRPPPPPAATPAPPARAASTAGSARPPSEPLRSAVSTGPITAAQVPKLLKETEVYVKYGLHDKAQEHLRRILEVDPENLDAHDKAKAVALALGRNDEAIASLARLIELADEARDPRATAAREELRGLDPNHPAIGGSGAGEEPELELEGEPMEVETLEAADGGIALEAEPLETVEPLEEEPAALELMEEDEPLELDVEPARSLPKPARPAAAAPAPAAKRAPPPVAPAAPASARAAQKPTAAPAMARKPAAAPAEEQDDFASELAEVDFYIQSGLVDDARSMLEAIILASPDHPGASARLQRLGSKARAVAPKADPGPRDDLAADLAAELAAEVAEEEAQENQPLDGDALDQFQVPAGEVLGEFRAKLQEVVRPEDVQTHYDLGIAYKEMGLIEEAFAEFELAFRHGGASRAADCLTMLGLCEMERGNAAASIERFRRGLALPDLAPEARKSLGYEMGAALESLGQNAEALEQFETVGREDPRFRDVAERVSRLGGDLTKVAAVGRARAAPGNAVGQKAAARASPATTTRAANDEPADDAAARGRKNRKIGFV